MTEDKDPDLEFVEGAPSPILSLSEMESWSKTVSIYKDASIDQVRWTRDGNKTAVITWDGDEIVVKYEEVQP